MSPPLPEAAHRALADNSGANRKDWTLSSTYPITPEALLAGGSPYRITAKDGFFVMANRHTLINMLDRIETKSSPHVKLTHNDSGKVMTLRRPSLALHCSGERKVVLDASLRMSRINHRDPTTDAVLRRLLGSGDSFDIAAENGVYGTANVSAMKAMLAGVKSRQGRRRRVGHQFVPGNIWIELAPNETTPTEIATKQSLGGGHTKP